MPGRSTGGGGVGNGASGGGVGGGSGERASFRGWPASAMDMQYSSQTGAGPGTGTGTTGGTGLGSDVAAPGNNKSDWRSIWATTAADQCGSCHDTSTPAAGPLNKFTCFGDLPVELRLKIWEMALPSRLVCFEHYNIYKKNPGLYPSVVLPPVFQACYESRALRFPRGLSYKFHELPSEEEDGKKIYNRIFRVEWYDRRNDVFWIRSIYAFSTWRGLEGTLAGGTVLANVLELVEDPYRGDEASRVFTHALLQGQFRGVKTFLLSMLTVQCSEDLGIYHNGSKRAVIDLDDDRLPDLLRPVFEQVRTMIALGGAQALTHKRPARLLQHLHGQWEGKQGLKHLFEEQWIQGMLRYNEDDPDLLRDIDDSLLTEERYGYRNRRPMVDRARDEIEAVMRDMPKIRPVIIFEKTIMPDWDDVGKGFRHPHSSRPFARGKRRDGLEAISNRRGLALSKHLLAGRRSDYGLDEYRGGRSAI
ncbi:hypothetical protein SLS62_007998 [Diatrype stigma]|uniref:2EXR domain-containing protein n=1 Tax=Diatrype stigma TaxID=117547 RepID=A0AAN9UPZ2_9PEZI